MAATLENIMEDFKEEPEHNEEHLQADPFYDITEDFEESEHTEEDGLLNDNVGVKPSEKRL